MQCDLFLILSAIIVFLIGAAVINEQLLQLLETHNHSLDLIRGQMAAFKVVVSPLMHTHPDRATLDGVMKITGPMAAKILPDSPHHASIVASL